MDRAEYSEEKACQACAAAIALPYWCETCERLVAEKRCLGCGLKARKVRHPEPKKAPK